MAHVCLVCGFPHLQEAPRSKSGGGSYEICPSCGFQFGVDDEDRGTTVVEWRKRWIKGGKKWASRGLPKPRDWDPGAQLRRLETGPGPGESPRRR